jgi:hypothetical protein
MGKFFGYASARKSNSLAQLAKVGVRLPAGFARWVFLAASQISTYQHVSRWVILPVSHEVVEFPQSKLLDLMESPSGSGCDVAKDKRPIGYTGTGIGSPATAFFNPETSSMALKRILKSSNVRPFSSCSAVRS